MKSSRFFFVKASVPASEASRSTRALYSRLAASRALELSFFSACLGPFLFELIALHTHHAPNSQRIHAFGAAKSSTSVKPMRTMCEMPKSPFPTFGGSGCPLTLYADGNGGLGADGAGTASIMAHILASTKPEVVCVYDAPNSMK